MKSQKSKRSKKSKKKKGMDEKEIQLSRINETVEDGQLHTEQDRVDKSRENNDQSANDDVAEQKNTVILQAIEEEDNE